MAFGNIKNIATSVQNTASKVSAGVNKVKDIVGATKNLVSSFKSTFGNRGGGIFDKIGGVFTGSLSNADDPTILSDGSYHTEKDTPAYGEPQRDWLYMVSIISPKFSDSNLFKSNTGNELIMRAKNFTMPQKTITTVETSFYGHKQVIPIDVDYERSFSISFEESEEQFILRNFNSWLNLFDVFSDVVSQEASNYSPGTASDIKSIFSSNIEFYMYRYSGEHEGVRITFYNCFPTSLGNASYGYDSTSKINFDINFSYDFFKIEKNNLASHSELTLAGGFGEVGEVERFKKLGRFGTALNKIQNAIKKARELKEKIEAAKDLVLDKVAQIKNVVDQAQSLLGKVGINSKLLGGASNFLGQTEESIKHGAAVMAKFGPILAKSEDIITLVGTTGEMFVDKAGVVKSNINKVRESDFVANLRKRHDQQLV